MYCSHLFVTLHTNYIYYYNALRKKGYNAIVDYNDATNGWSDNPIIIFDKDALSKMPVIKIKDLQSQSNSKKTANRVAAEVIQNAKGLYAKSIAGQVAAAGALGAVGAKIEQDRRKKKKE